MQTTKQKGDVGEELAVLHLQEIGFAILARNERCRYGEIDAIAQKGAKIHFVEIRRRTSQAYGSALLSISEAKKGRWRRTAEYLLFKNRQWRRLIPYFSVVTIDEDENAEGTVRIEFLTDAMGC